MAVTLSCLNDPLPLWIACSCKQTFKVSNPISSANGLNALITDEEGRESGDGVRGNITSSCRTVHLCGTFAFHHQPD